MRIAATQGNRPQSPCPTPTGRVAVLPHLGQQRLHLRHLVGRTTHHDSSALGIRLDARRIAAVAREQRLEALRRGHRVQPTQTNHRDVLARGPIELLDDLSHLALFVGQGKHTHPPRLRVLRHLHPRQQRVEHLDDRPGVGRLQRIDLQLRLSRPAPRSRHIQRLDRLLHQHHLFRLCRHQQTVRPRIDRNLHLVAIHRLRETRRLTWLTRLRLFTPAPSSEAAAIAVLPTTLFRPPVRKHRRRDHRPGSRARRQTKQVPQHAIRFEWRHLFQRERTERPRTVRHAPRGTQQRIHLAKIAADIGDEQPIRLLERHHLPLRPQQLLNVPGRSLRIGPLERQHNADQLILAPRLQLFERNLRDQIGRDAIVDIQRHEEPIPTDQDVPLLQKVPIQHIERFGDGVLPIVIVVERAGWRGAQIEREVCLFRKPFQDQFPWGKPEVERQLLLTIDHNRDRRRRIGRGRLAGSGGRNGTRLSSRNRARCGWRGERRSGWGAAGWREASKTTGTAVTGTTPLGSFGRRRRRGTQFCRPRRLLFLGQHGEQLCFELGPRLFSFLARDSEAARHRRLPRFIDDRLKLRHLLGQQLQFGGDRVIHKGCPTLPLPRQLPQPGELLGRDDRFELFFRGEAELFRARLHLGHQLLAFLISLGRLHLLENRRIELTALRLGNFAGLRHLLFGQLEFRLHLGPQRLTQSAAPPAAKPAPKPTPASTWPAKSRPTKTRSATRSAPLGRCVGCGGTCRWGSTRGRNRGRNRISRCRSRRRRFGRRALAPGR